MVAVGICLDLAAVAACELVHSPARLDCRADRPITPGHLTRGSRVRANGTNRTIDARVGQGCSAVPIARLRRTVNAASAVITASVAPRGQRRRALPVRIRGAHCAHSAPILRTPPPPPPPP